MDHLILEFDMDHSRLEDYQWKLKKIEKEKVKEKIKTLHLVPKRYEDMLD